MDIKFCFETDDIKLADHIFSIMHSSNATVTESKAGSNVYFITGDFSYRCDKAIAWLKEHRDEISGKYILSVLDGNSGQPWIFSDRSLRYLDNLSDTGQLPDIRETYLKSKEFRHSYLQERKSHQK